MPVDIVAKSLSITRVAATRLLVHLEFHRKKTDPSFHLRKSLPTSVESYDVSGSGL